MEISTLQIDLFVLVMALVGLVFSAWLLRRYPLQFWYEKRLLWLFPKDVVVAAETMAQEHPYRHMVLMFIVMVGAFAIVIDIGSTLGTPSLGPLVRYGVAAGVAVFSLYANRASAARRAQVRGGSGQDG